MKPFTFLSGLFSNTVRLALTLIGFLLLIIGIALSLTVIGALIGIPLILVGVVLLVIGSLFQTRTVRRGKTNGKKQVQEEYIDVEAKKID